MSSGRLFSQSVADTRRQPTSGSSSRSSPYSRDGGRRSTSGAGAGGAPDGKWTHDGYEAQYRVGSSALKHPTRTLLVQDLHYEVTVAELSELFSRIGRLERPPHIVYDRSGRSTGRAYIAYERTQDAEDARAEYDGAKAKGQTISIVFTPDRFGPPSGAGAHGAAGGNRRLEDRINKGDLLSRLGNGEPGTSKGRGDRRAPSGPGAGSSDAGAGARERSARGVSGSGAGGREAGARGGRGGREKRAPKTASDLDAELEAFMAAPPADAGADAPDVKPNVNGAAQADAAAPGANAAPKENKAANAQMAASMHAVRNADGDVEMDG